MLPGFPDPARRGWLDPKAAQTQVPHGAPQAVQLE